MTGINEAHLYDHAGVHFAMGHIPWKAATTKIYMALYTSDLVPDQANDEVYSTTHELANGAGYTRGGIPLTLYDPVIVGSGPGAYAKLYGDTAVWYNATFTGVQTVITYYNPDAGSKYLIGYMHYAIEYAAEDSTFPVYCPPLGYFIFGIE